MVYIKVKGKDEITFPKCYFTQNNRIIFIHASGIGQASTIIGAFKEDVVEYVYWAPSND